MKTVNIVLTVALSAGIAAAQNTRGENCLTAPAPYSPYIVTQTSASSGSAPATALVLIPAGTTSAAMAAASSLATQLLPTGTAATQSGTSTREPAPQITSVVYAPDSCSIPNTLIMVYGMGFGTKSAPTVAIATAEEACLVGTSAAYQFAVGESCSSYNQQAGGDYVGGSMTTSYVPLVATTSVLSWSDTLVVIDTSIGQASAGYTSNLVTLTNNDTHGQTSFCQASPGQNCTFTFVINPFAHTAPTVY